MFLVVPFSRLSSVFKPVLSVFATYSFFVPQAVARLTLPSFSIFCSCKQVSVNAIFPSGRDCYWTIPPEDVRSLADKLKMLRVAATFVFAKMVQLVILSIDYPGRDFTELVCISDPVNSVCPASKPGKSVASSIFCPYPQPTRVCFFNPFMYSGKLFIGQNRREVFHIKL